VGLKKLFGGEWIVKKERRASLLSYLLNWKEQDIFDYLAAYSKWFNSAVSDTFILYNEQLKMFILSKESNLAIQNLSSHLILMLNNDFQNKEFNDCRLNDCISLRKRKQFYIEMLD
jgi:hypothetical protein